MLYSTLLFLCFCMDFGIAETGIARGSPPGTTTEVLRVGFPSEEIRVVSSTIPEAVPVKGVVSETQEATKAATEPAEVASEGAPGVAEKRRDEVLPESSMEVVVCSPEIQDAEPIRSAPMSGTTTTSRGGIELLADDLVNPAAVAHNLEAMRRAEQWMKASYQYP
jgi:hypothetical protein